VQGKSHCR